MEVGLKKETAARAEFGRSELLRWLYVGRMTLAAGILAGILVAWESAPPQASRIATLMFLVALAVTLGSAWHTHFRGRPVGHNFLYTHVILDVALVTTIVHITTVGDEVVFAPLYILVITEGALLLPLPGGVLIGALAAIVYFADLVWGHPAIPLSGAISLQIGLFAGVALITGWLGDRVRRTGLALGAVQTELARLRLDKGDILANISTGVLTIVEGGRLAYLNPAAEELLGFPLDKWEGSVILDAVDEVAPGLALALRSTVERRRPVHRVKTPAKQRGGRQITLGISTTVLEGAEGEEPSVTAIFQDITELERVELLNRQNERLEAVAELSASLAHEIKNPLASIRSAVEQLDNALAGDDRALLQRLVLSESDRLSRLLSEFLEFSGMQINAEAGVDFAAVVRDAVALVKQHPAAEEWGVIECEGVDEPLTLPGDSDLLHRLVFNLILNAIQFSGPDGCVRVSLQDYSGPGAPTGTGVSNPVRLSVQDSGPGVQPEHLGRIFDPFFTTREGGSGLGLAVVHRAVKAHEGTLFVEDAIDGGAHFLVYLPGTHTAAVPVGGAAS